jgi:hypothetical protein
MGHWKVFEDRCGGRMNAYLQMAEWYDHGLLTHTITTNFSPARGWTRIPGTREIFPWRSQQNHKSGSFFTANPGEP